MDSTGENWKIQVPDYTAQLLMTKGYTCAVCVLCFVSGLLKFIQRFLQCLKL